MRKVLLRILAVMICAVIMLFTYINIVHSDVDSQLRLPGFIYDQFIRFDDVESLAVMSKQSRDRFINIETDVAYEEIEIESRDGKKIRVLITKSDTTEAYATGLLWFHGGGYASLAPETDLEFVNEIIKDTNTVAIIPDYTLSVDEPYPAALYDAYDTLLWMKEHEDELGINSNQIFVGGGSAGGGLTASVSMYARDQGEINIAFQMPLFPMINDKMDKHNQK